MSLPLTNRDNRSLSMREQVSARLRHMFNAGMDYERQRLIKNLSQGA